MEFSGISTGLFGSSQVSKLPLWALGDGLTWGRLSAGRLLPFSLLCPFRVNGRWCPVSPGVGSPGQESEDAPGLQMRTVHGGNTSLAATNWDVCTFWLICFDILDSTPVSPSDNAFFCTHRKSRKQLAAKWSDTQRENQCQMSTFMFSHLILTKTMWADLVPIFQLKKNEVLRGKLTQILIQVHLTFKSVLFFINYKSQCQLPFMTC